MFEEFDYCPTLRALIEQSNAGQAQVGETGKELTAGGISTVNNLRVIRRLMLDRKPKKTLEVGLLFATSALCITSTSAEYGIAESHRHHAIDPFQTEHWDNIGRRVLRDAGLLDAVEIHEELSCFALPAICKEGHRFDLIYIDGSHIFEDVFIDVYYAWQLLNVGGVMLLDDCTDAHVAKVIRFVQSNLSGYFDPMDLTPYRNRSQTLKQHIGRVLGRYQIQGFEKKQDAPRDWNAPLGVF